MGNKLQDKMQKMKIDAISIRFYKQVIPLLISVCKLFSLRYKTIHALLASKRCLIGLQKVPF